MLQKSQYAMSIAEFRSAEVHQTPQCPNLIATTAILSAIAFNILHGLLSGSRYFPWFFIAVFGAPHASNAPVFFEPCNVS